MNLFNVSVAVGLGLLVGCLVYVLGTVMDRMRDRRWQRELTEVRPPLPVRIVKQRENEENEGGA